VAQEILHSLKTRKLKGVVVKIDLFEAYDQVNWIYIRMLMTHLGFSPNFIRWKMICLSSITFAIIINGVASPFFKVERGLLQGCPFSPLLFLLVAEGLSLYLENAKRSGGGGSKEYKFLRYCIYLTFFLLMTY
jgi:hypothetical protein